MALPSTRSLMFAAGMGVFIVAGFAAWAADDAWTEHCLATSGREAIADVIGKSERHGKSTSYILDYRFSDAASSVVNGSQRVSRQRFLKVTLGDQVPVFYCHGNPSRHSIDVAALRRQREFHTWGSVALALVLAGIWLFERYRRSLEQQAGATDELHSDDLIARTSDRLPRRYLR